MKNWFDTPRGIFAVLRVMSAMCIALGVILAATLGVRPVLMRVSQEGLSLADGLILLSMAVNAVLWCIAWGTFMGLCGRMMRGGTAFTAQNGRSLSIIGGCVAAIGLLVFLRCGPRLVTGPWLYALIEGVVLPGAFGTVAMLAFVLRRLLKNAMALEAEQQGVI